MQLLPEGLVNNQAVAFSLIIQNSRQFCSHDVLSDVVEQDTQESFSMPVQHVV